MTVEHRIEVSVTATETDKNGNVVRGSECDLTDGQIETFRGLCDECFADTNCSDGARCCFYKDRLFRGGES